MCFVYRDRTFCSFWKECEHGKDGKNQCHRALTDRVIAGAEKAGLPTSQFVNKPDCFKELKC